MKRMIVIAAAFAVLAGCSKAPSAIKATTAVGQPFATYDCPALVAERVAYVDRLEQSKKIQGQRAAGDVILAVGFGAIGLVAGKAVAGQDEEVNIGSYRGAIIEIDNESRRKACVEPGFFVPEPAPPKTATSSSTPS